jgi:aconitate hydratase
MTAHQSATEKLLAAHTVEDKLVPGEPISIGVDQVLLQDVLGPLVWIEFEALEYNEVKPNVVVQYIDHQVYQTDYRDTDTHRYLRTVSQRYGAHFSRAGNGICHQVHRERFVTPGATVLGSDSHTTTMGGFGALGIGAGGLDVAIAMGGEPYTLEMPAVVRVELTGELRSWSSAKDVILELLRRLSVKGGVGKAFEFVGPGVETLSVPERCTITNMVTELGATSGLFPSDEQTREHLTRLGRMNDYQRVKPDPEATYHETITLDLSEIQPLVATPSMPDAVVPAAEVAGTDVDQVIVGSCTNGSYLDVATAAMVVTGQNVAPGTEFVVAPASKRTSQLLVRNGLFAELYAAGVNVSESTCGPCIGQGHVPATDSVSLRAFNRNFSGRSGLEDDAIYLCSPEVAAVGALEGEICDPRETTYDPPIVALPDDMRRSSVDVLDPDPTIEVDRGPTVGTVPLRNPPAEEVSGPVLITVGDDVTTDHIMPATMEVMSLWSDPQACAEYTLHRIDPSFSKRAQSAERGWVVAGENYGQGSSRENAALELAVLGVDGVIAKSFARIHRANLVNFGVLPFTFTERGTSNRLEEGDSLTIEGVHTGIRENENEFTVTVNNEWTFHVELNLTSGEREILADGGLLNHVKSG